MIRNQFTICGINGCRRRSDHQTEHNTTPAEVWGFLREVDKKKLAKAGFATPRGGPQNGYQNHVVRSSKVIIPFERLDEVPFDELMDGYVIRLHPEQYFLGAGVVRPIFNNPNPRVIVGDNAFILYRTHDQFVDLPPLEGWIPRQLLIDGQQVSKRDRKAEDQGHYLQRTSAIGAFPALTAGPPQGIFEPEYADVETNYLAKCVLAWLIIQTSGSPYTLNQAGHLVTVLNRGGLAGSIDYENRGVLRHGLCCCPLCTKVIHYAELHSVISFDGEDALANAPTQAPGATRSTVVNLFHLSPLIYETLAHAPANLGWGHATCNTRLGQRKCYSINELMDGNKVGVITDDGVSTFGWISDDWQMIRSPEGSVWIQLNGDNDEIANPIAGSG